MKKKLYYTRDTYYCKVNDITGFTPYDIPNMKDKYLISGNGKTPDEVYCNAKKEVLANAYPYKIFLHAYFEGMKNISYLIPNYHNIQQELYKRYIHLYYINNMERCKNYQKEYNKTHKEKIRNRNVKYRNEHLEELRAKSKSYREKNKTRLQAKSKSYREKNKEIIKFKKRKYYEQHKTEKYNYDLNRRINKVMYWVNKFGGRCEYCGKIVVYGDYHNRPEFHHTIPERKCYDLMYMFSRPGTFTDKDIEDEIKTGGVILLCHDCHNAETQKQNRMLNEKQINKLKLMRKSGKTINYIKDYFGFKSSTSVYDYLKR